MVKAKKIKKAAKKTAKGATRKPSKAKKAPKKAAVKAKANKARKPKPAVNLEKQVPGGLLLGEVEDYFAHVGVVALTLKKPLAVGETIRVKGHTTDITHTVESMQLDHLPVASGSAGQSVGVKLPDRARKGDAVYKV